MRSAMCRAALLSKLVLDAERSPRFWRRAHGDWSPSSWIAISPQACASSSPVEVRSKILEQNILATDFAALRGAEEKKLLVVGNLPYYITSDILLRLFRFHASIERAVVMIQREVATRVAAQPGTSDYGVLSATTQMYARVESLLTLPPEAFSPRPQVHSTVLRLTMTPRFDELQVQPDEFLPFVRSCFAQKRKMLRKNLRNAEFEAEAIAAAMEKYGVSAGSRAEELQVEALAGLWRELNTQP